MALSGLALALGATAGAQASTYDLTACASSPGGAINRLWVPVNSSPATLGVSATCPPEGSASGLLVQDMSAGGADTPPSARAEWVFAAPPGTTVVHLLARQWKSTRGDPGWIAYVRDSAGSLLSSCSHLGDREIARRGGGWIVRAVTPCLLLNATRLLHAPTKSGLSSLTPELHLRPSRPQQSGPHRVGSHRRDNRHDAPSIQPSSRSHTDAQLVRRDVGSKRRNVGAGPVASIGKLAPTQERYYLAAGAGGLQPRADPSGSRGTAGYGLFRSEWGAGG